MRRPTITVIITVYERWTFLRTAVRDALGQTFGDIEVLVTDDCSEGDVRAVLADVDDPRLVIRRNPRRLGAGGNFAAAAMEASGELIASLNDDDRWKPRFLETMLGALSAHPDAVLAFCDYEVIDEAGAVDIPATNRSSRAEGRDGLRPGLHQPFSESALIDRSVFFANAVLVRQAAVDWRELADSGVQHHWDHYCNYLASRSGDGAVYVGERLTQHRVHPRSQTELAGHASIAAKFRLAESAMLCNDRFRRDERLRRAWPVYDRRWAAAAATLGVAYLRIGDRPSARASLRASWRTERTLRAALALAVSWLPARLSRKVAQRVRRGQLPAIRRPTQRQRPIGERRSGDLGIEPGRWPAARTGPGQGRLEP